MISRVLELERFSFCTQSVIFGRKLYISKSDFPEKPKHLNKEKNKGIPAKILMLFIIRFCVVVSFLLQMVIVCFVFPFHHREQAAPSFVLPLLFP